MAILTTKISQIRNAVYGKEVRESIAGGIEAINEETELVTTRQASLENHFRGLTINAGSSNAEIVVAHTSGVTGESFDTLGDRVDDVDIQVASKRDKTIAITGSDIDITSDAKKIGLNQLNDAARASIAGTAAVNAVPSALSINNSHLAPGAVTSDKLESRIQQKIALQLANKGIHMSNGGPVQSTDGVSTVDMLTNTSYGTVGLAVPNVSGNKYLVFSKIENLGSASAYFTKMVAYNNLPTVSGRVETNGQAGIGSILTIAAGTIGYATDSITSVSAKLAIALTVTTATIGARYKVTQKVYNVTGWNDSKINALKILAITAVPDCILSSDNAETAGKALSADSANVATIANSVKDGVITLSSLSSKLQTKIFEMADVMYSSDGKTIRNAGASSVVAVDNNTVEFTTAHAGDYVGYNTGNIMKPSHKYISVCITEDMGNTGGSLPNIYEFLNGSWASSVGQRTLASGGKVTQVLTRTMSTTLALAGSYGLMCLMAPTDQVGKNMRFTVKSYDVTGYTDEAIAAIDWENLPSSTIVIVSDTAITALNAKNAENAEYAEDGPFIRASLKHENLLGDQTKLSIMYNGITGGINTAGVISGTPTISWGAFMVTCAKDIVVGRKYLMTFLVKAEKNINCSSDYYEYNGGAQLYSYGKAAQLVTTEWTRMSDIRTILQPATTNIKFGLQNLSGDTPFTKLYMKDVMAIDITDFDLSPDDVDLMGGFWESYAASMLDYSVSSGYASVAGKAMALDDGIVLSSDSSWKDSNVLAIGDSLTAGHLWALEVARILKCNMAWHAKGGLGITQLVDGDQGLGGTYDNTTEASGILSPLDAADVTGKDLIIYYGGYNDRGTADGVVGDVYPDQNTIAGRIQHVINRIFECLEDAGNVGCRVMLITPHCAGKYPYINYDGYQEYPPNSGQTMGTLANIIKSVANANNIPCYDSYHESGINRWNWTIYGASPSAIKDPPGSGVPYPNNGDQLHMSTAGYVYHGGKIAKFIDTI